MLAVSADASTETFHLPAKKSLWKPETEARRLSGGPVRVDGGDIQFTKVRRGIRVVPDGLLRDQRIDLCLGPHQTVILVA